jgi:hypothetical protein
MPANQTVHTGDAPSRRARFQYHPDRHYVLAEVASANYNGEPLDELLNEIDDATGDDAYQIEADGSKGPEQRQAARSNRMMLLSCPKTYIDKKIRESTNASNERRMLTEPETEESYERIAMLEAISVNDITGKGSNSKP